MEKLKENVAEQILREHAIPDDKPFNIRDNAFVLEAEIVNEPQLLRPLRPFPLMELQIPPSLPTEAQIVLKLLFDCFDKHKVVAEGLIGDLMWGFAQAVFPPPLTHVNEGLTYTGLCQLEREGYVKFQAKDGAYLGPGDEQIGGAWVRYQPKLLDMVYQGRDPEKLHMVYQRTDMQ